MLDKGSPEVTWLQCSQRTRRWYNDNQEGMLESGWRSVLTQKVRFAASLRMISALQMENLSVMDFGCGVADFVDYAHFLMRFYAGVEVRERQLELAKEKVRRYDFPSMLTSDPLEITEQIDVIVLHGVFGFSDQDMQKTVHCLLHQFWPHLLVVDLLSSRDPSVAKAQNDLVFDPVGVVDTLLTEEYYRFSVDQSWSRHAFTVGLYRGRSELEKKFAMSPW